MIRVKVTYTAKHLAKSATYFLDFYNNTAGACQLLSSPASFVTTATGVGKVTAQIEVAEGDYEFFVDAVTSAGKPFGNDSFTVTLPRP
jgi:hypothetical protein